MIHFNQHSINKREAIMSKKPDPNKVVKPTKTDVEKSAKFKEIAGKRTRNALKQIRLIGNCTSNNYRFTKPDVDKILKVLNDDIAALSTHFDNALRGGVVKKKDIDFSI